MFFEMSRPAAVEAERPPLTEDILPRVAQRPC